MVQEQTQDTGGKQDVGLSYYDKSKIERENGKKGLNNGIPMPASWKRMKEVLPNIQPKYYVLLADSGVGKSKLGHFIGMYNTFFQFIQGTIKDFELWLYTAEMTIEEVIGEFHALYYYHVKGRLTDIDQIYSYGENSITKELDEFLASKEVEEITNKLEKKVHIINERINSGFLYKEIQTIARNNGIVNRDKNGKFISYTKHNPDKWIIILFDNFQKLNRTKDENSLRESIIKVSAYMDVGRLLFRFVMIAMQQVNRNNKSFDRYKYEQFFHKEEDLKDSEAPFHDCQVCISQISPYKLDLDEFDNYTIKGNEGLEDRFRALKIIKNRGGQAFGVNYFMFLGECAMYKEIPYPEKLPKDFYSKINNLKKNED